MARKQKDFSKILYTEEEWCRMRRYQRVPLHQKLAMLDRMRSLMFDLWKENPDLRRHFEKRRFKSAS